MSVYYTGSKAMFLSCPKILSGHMTVRTKNKLIFVSLVNIPINKCENTKYFQFTSGL